MALLSGSASISRFRVLSRPEEPDFDSARFTEIAPGSEVRESIGFVPMEPDAPYQVGHSRFAFRVRIDTLRADSTAVKERLRSLIQAETEATGNPFVGSRKRRQLKALAEEELIVRSAPRSRIVEGCVDGDRLYIATTARSRLGTVLVLLQRIGITAAPLAPWNTGEEDRAFELESTVVEAKEEGQSVLGCRFLKALVGDRELFFEPAAGSVKLQTHDAKVTLSGAILGDLLRYLDRGAEILSAKLTTGEIDLRLDALDFRASGLRLETERHEHWTELLDERLEKLEAVWDLLDRKYRELAPRFDTAPEPTTETPS
ncbi:MAG: hypothetical protein SX243_06945 [Acidobacteriota bacterium]|nr:hypothetical protein [Acidobacteriota bacterium]